MLLAEASIGPPKTPDPGDADFRQSHVFELAKLFLDKHALPFESLVAMVQSGQFKIDEEEKP